VADGLQTVVKFSNCVIVKQICQKYFNPHLCDTLIREYDLNESKTWSANPQQCSVATDETDHVHTKQNDGEILFDA